MPCHTKLFVVLLFLVIGAPMFAADHGPVFGLATPTNPQGGWSLDLGLNGRGGADVIAAGIEAALPYGVTANLKLSVSAPLVI